MADIVFPGQTAGQLGASELPANYDLVLYRGDFFRTFVVIKDSDNVVINLTGYEAKCSIKTGYGASSSFDAVCTITPLEGKVEIHFPSSVTETIAAGDYIWDFQVTNPSDDVKTYIAGDVKVWDEITT
jgi:hypothetical protein